MKHRFCRVIWAGLLAVTFTMAAGAVSAESQADRERKSRVQAFKDLTGRDADFAAPRIRCTWTCSEPEYNGTAVISGGVNECLALCEVACGEPCEVVSQ